VGISVRKAEVRVEDKKTNPTDWKELGIYLSTCQEAIRKKEDTILSSSELNKILEDVREMESDFSYRRWLVIRRTGATPSPAPFTKANPQD